MKFRIGDKVTLVDAFATYKGKVSGHSKRINWPYFWKKVNVYLIDIITVNGKYADGSLAVTEKDLIHSDEISRPRSHLRPVGRD